MGLLKASFLIVPLSMTMISCLATRPLKSYNEWCSATSVAACGLTSLPPLSSFVALPCIMLTYL